MANRITLTFNADMQIDEFLYFLGIEHTTSGTQDIQFQEQWKSLRTAPYEVTYNQPSSYPGERSAIDFVNAFNLDFAGFGLLVSRTANVVVITTFASNPDNYIEFYEDGFYGSVPDGRVRFVFGDVTTESISILNVDYAQAIDNNSCSHVKVLITTSEVASNYKIASTNVSGNTNNPIEIELLREHSFIIQVWNDPNHITSQPISTLGYLNMELINIEVIPSPNGGSIQITDSLPTFPVPLGLTFSLNNEDWQSDNTFSGLENGDYTLYIKDAFGCHQSKPFSISNTNITVPFFSISKNNSIRFAQRINWGTGGNYKNDENTLSCESFARDEKLAYKEVQLFQTNDKITTQFKSNYAVNRVFTLDANGVEIQEIPVIQKSQNIGQKDMRDARLYDLGNGKNAVYFTTGSIYNFDTMVSTGEVHHLFGALPYWATRLGYMKIYTSFNVYQWVQLESTFYDPSKNAEAVVFSGNYSGADMLVKAGSVYNVFDYEIYEFEIDFDVYIDNQLKVITRSYNEENINEIIHLSEIIDVKVNQKDTVEIRYWNDNNTDVFYQTGIKHLIRIKIDNIIGLSEGDYENNKTDSTTILIDSALYEADNFIFEPLTKEMWRKVMRALSCKMVFIDNVQRVKNGDFETESLGDTNLYVLTANLIKTGQVFNSQSDGLNEFNFGNAEIIGLIDSGGNAYIKY